MSIIRHGLLQQEHLNPCKLQLNFGDASASCIVLVCVVLLQMPSKMPVPVRLKCLSDIIGMSILQGVLHKTFMPLCRDEHMNGSSLPRKDSGRLLRLQKQVVL